MGAAFTKCWAEEFGPQDEAYSMAARGDAEGLKRYLSAGNDPNAPAPWLATRELLLHRAAREGQEQCIRILLQAGAFIDVDSADGTALMCAARWGHIEAADLLLSHDADARAVFKNKTAAVVAAEAGHAELASLLKHTATEQGKDLARVQARLLRRQQADAAVELKSLLAIEQEHREVAAVDQDIVAKRLGLERFLTCVLKPCGAPRGGRGALHPTARGPVRLTPGSSSTLAVAVT
ncbi:hypothetical protein D9Q98_006469 [Chlorella vulgaris]|uniref:Uncharacterized protein n=1 Tax=Chlorella vulgaris TaxID=3077 RepID=A0A9D4YVC4_CHLVU|nr:hypothetical protein D9Q98_006469 [Chlorella vulgaris]